MLVCVICFAPPNPYFIHATAMTVIEGKNAHQKTRLFEKGKEKGKGFRNRHWRYDVDINSFHDHLVSWSEEIYARLFENVFFLAFLP